MACIEEPVLGLIKLAVERPGVTVFSPGAYNLTIGRQPEFVWYRVPKVCSRSILAHVREHCALALDEAWDRSLSPDACREHFAFAFVRNPWERLVSTWTDKALGRHNHFGLSDATRQSFRSFVHWVAKCPNLATGEEHFRLQSALIDLDRVEYVGRFEAFPEHFGHVCDRLGIPRLERHLNASEHLPYHLYYDDGLLNLVGDLYARDITTFGYEPAPALLQEALTS